MYTVVYTDFVSCPILMLYVAAVILSIPCHSRSAFSIFVPKLHCVYVNSLGIGDCLFHVMASHTWNSLPASVTAPPSLTVYKRHLKSFFF